MANWSDMLDEINEARPLDSIRRKYLAELSEYTNRNTIAYYSAFLERQVSNIDINDSDMNGFMNAVSGVSQILCKLQMLALNENGMWRRAGLPVRCLVYLGTEILRAVKGDGVSRRSYTLDSQGISVTPACDPRNIR